MATSGPETKLTQKVLAWLNSLEGVHATKVHGSRFSAGQPDILACVRGRMLQIEMKSPTLKAAKPTPLQAKRLREWGDAGAVTMCANSHEEVAATVFALLDDPGLTATIPSA